MQKYKVQEEEFEAGDDYCDFHDSGYGICTCEEEICKDCNKDKYRCSCKEFNPW